MNLFDMEAAEKAEQQIDLFISKRCKEKEEVNAVEAMWRASERRQRRKVQISNGHAWVDYFDHLASCHERRAGEYRDRSREVAAMVEVLAGEGGGGDT